MTPDVNVLLAAFRSDHPHHVVALACVRAGFSGVAPVAARALYQRQ
jgi:predicted nucleic acid-binding protein